MYTGLPLNLCLDQTLSFKAILITIINIAFWFAIIFLLWKVILKLLKKPAKQ